MYGEWVPVVRMCRNCGAKTVGYGNGKGIVKVTCGKCGARSVSRMIGRRCERCDTYAPPGMSYTDNLQI